MNKQQEFSQNEVHVVFGEETAFWKANCEELSARYPGKWLLIRGSEVVDVLDTFSEATRALRALDAIALIQPVDPGMARDAIFLAHALSTSTKGAPFSPVSLRSKKPLKKSNATPAKAGVHPQSFLDSRFHGNDGEGVPRQDGRL